VGSCTTDHRSLLIHRFALILITSASFSRYIESMCRFSVLPAVSLVLIAGVHFFPDTEVPIVEHASRNVAVAYLGFDLNTYPGDAALPILRKTFSFAGYWLSPPPGAKRNTWVGKRQFLLSQKFGFLLLYRGPQSSELKSSPRAITKGAADGANAAAAAKREGFPSHAIIFLDIEEGGRLPAKYHAYLRAWVDALARVGDRAGVYCSGMPVNEGNGVTVITADDIRNQLGKGDLSYFVYNDACPPSPGCVVAKNPPLPSVSGIPYAAVWQFAQSPRRAQFTARCGAGYNADGNCYAPNDHARAWFLDLDSATMPDPSGAADAGR
jgi:hypothetical protein